MGLRLVGGKIDQAKKVFENLLLFITRKKDVFILYYFYISFYLKKDLYNMSKDHQGDILQLLWVRSKARSRQLIL